ncbi:MAG: YggU family protein [Deltaproteobacteria bacterium]|nr:YggU family protein [Deltaproteobacteria bacterium]
MVQVREADGSVSFDVRVQPRSRKTAMTGTEGDRVKIALQAPPVDGKANEALVRFLAEELGVGRSSVEILRGETGRNKTVRVYGVTREKVEAWLASK